jgi:hypothetical protein
LLYERRCILTKAGWLKVSPCLRVFVEGAEEELFGKKLLLGNLALFSAPAFRCIIRLDVVIDNPYY